MKRLFFARAAFSRITASRREQPPTPNPVTSPIASSTIGAGTVPILARLRGWLVEAAMDPEAGAAAVLGCIYLLLLNLVDVFGYVHQNLPLVVASNVRALIMVLILALLPAGRYLSSCLTQPRRWMFMVPAVLAAFECVRSVGSIYRTHVIASAIIACIALTFAVDFPDRVRRWITPNRTRLFCVAAILSVLLGHAILNPKPDTIGQTSIDAFRSMSIGLNPYKVDLDAFDYELNVTRAERFRGYKYSPLLPIIYSPFVKLSNSMGILLTNMTILLFVTFTVYLISRRILAGNGKWTASLLLASPLVGYSTLISQVNDLIAVFPICVAFLVWGSRPGVAGLLLGASVSIKISPAPIAIAVLLPQEVRTLRTFVAGIVIGTIPMILFAALDPYPFFNNVVLFELFRPAYRFTRLLDMPPSVIWLLRVGFVAALTSTAAAALTRSWSIDRRMIAYVVLVIGLLLSSQISQDQYWLWWIPIFLPLLGTMPKPLNE